MTKAGKIVLAACAALLCGAPAFAQEAIAPAAGLLRGPARPADEPIPFSASPYLSREFAPDLPSTFPALAPPINLGPPPASAGPAGPRRILPYVQVEAGYVLLMYKKDSTPIPTLTAGSTSDQIPGAIGQPGTTALFQRPGGNDGPISAGRARVVTWLPEFEVLSLEVIGWGAESNTIGLVTTSADHKGQAISRPYFNPTDGINDAFAVSVPGIFSSVSTDAFKTHQYGGEANLRYNFLDHCTSLFGVRYLRVDENYSNQDNITSEIDGTLSVFRDSFTTNNRFFGPQIGLNYNTGKDLLTLDLFAKIAVGVNHQTAIVSGSSVFTDPVTGAVFVEPTRGTYAQPTNIGRYRHTNISTVPEAGVNLRFAVGPKCSLAVSYSALLFTNMIRPSGQMDFTVNPQALVGATQPPFQPSPPTFQHTEFWIQSISFGLEYLF